jgi:hypothetical protein
MTTAPHPFGDMTHHAYLVEGERVRAVEGIFSALESVHGIRRAGNPDIFYHETDTLLIDDAHMLRMRERYASVDGGKKIFVVAFETITLEAQNALLKTIEEPTPGTHFFFVTRSPEALLPTVRSRMVLLKISEEEGDGAGGRKDARKFLGSDIAGRMKQIAPIVKEKDKGTIRDLLDGLESELYAKANGATEKESMRALDDVLSAKRHLLGRTPFIKVLLEHLALTLPCTR